MPTPSSWRALLKEVISDTAERGRIAKTIGVHPMTLSRWAQGVSATPRPQKLRQLVQAFPAHQRAVLSELLQREYGALTEFDSDESETEQIDYAFIQHIWETRATTPASLLFWAITENVLENALRQLDSQSLGMVITVAQLMPPAADGRIRSLREVAGLASPPWPANMEHHMLFLGAESLAGHAVSRGRIEYIDDLHAQETFLPVYQVEYEVSTVACPIMHANRLAGCVIFSSTQPDYFRSERRRALVHDYTRLLAPAFQPGHFFELEQIELQLLPLPEVQQAHFVSFQLRVNALMVETYKTSHALTRPQAEQLVWQQIEEELLRLPYRPD